MTNEISEVTRRSIVDYLLSAGITWSGRFSEDEFLARLYDLASLPSTDHRFDDAARDIRQHRTINPNDWEDDWLFYDDRFNLFWASDEQFLAFLCETVHPVVQPDTKRTYEMVAAYNQELKADGWRLIENRKISNRPVYVSQKIGARTQIFEEPTGWQKVDRQVQEVRLRLDDADSEEQFQAVGLLCREALISVAQAVFEPSRHTIPDSVDLSSTDSKRMLESIFEKELVGSGNEESRAHAKAALKLALALQHKRTADFRMAALCAEATASVVNLLAVLSGRRGRSL